MFIISMIEFNHITKGFLLIKINLSFILFYYYDIEEYFMSTNLFLFNKNNNSICNYLYLNI